MKRFLLLAALAVSMASCSPFVLKSSGALNGSDLTIYKTFTVQKIDKSDLPENIAEYDILRLYKALGNELVLRGYSYVADASAADLTLHLGLSKKRHMETDSFTSGIAGGFAGGPGRGPGHGGYNYYGATPYAHNYFSTTTSNTEMVTEGVLVVDLVDNKGNNHVFCAQISANIDGEQMLLKDNKLLGEAAAKAFKKFPVEIPKKK
ncbi:MAG: DUF4136 domain-containing protein [Rikenellaceae bacterium]